MRHYTIGEIYRQGLLLNHKGEPYKHKSTISKIVRGMKIEKRMTPFGPAKTISESEIARHNKLWKTLAR